VLVVGLVAVALLEEPFVRSVGVEGLSTEMGIRVSSYTYISYQFSSCSPSCRIVSEKQSTGFIPFSQR